MSALPSLGFKPYSRDTVSCRDKDCLVTDVLACLFLTASRQVKNSVARDLWRDEDTCTLGEALCERFPHGPQVKKPSEDLLMQAC